MGDFLNQAFLPGNTQATVTSLNDAGNATVGGTLTTTAVVDQGALSETGLINPTGLTGTLNDWAPTGFSGARYVYLTLASAATITGIAGGTVGRVVTLIMDVSPNTGAATVSPESASSAAANRIQLQGTTAWTLSSGQTGVLTLRYNGTAQRWQQLSGTSNTVNYSATFATTVALSGQVAFGNTLTPSALAATVNDWSPTAALDYRTAPASGGSTLTGLATGVASSRIAVITNISTGIDNIILKHDDGASSTAANRFLLPYNQSIVIPPGGSAILRYDATSARWRPIDTPPQLNAPYAQPMQSGRYYFIPNMAATASGSVTNGIARFVPFWVPNLITIQRLGGEVMTIGDVGSKVRLGIYADDGTGRPGALLLDAGTIAGDSATVQEIGSLSLSLTPGMYWAVWAPQVVTTTTPTLRWSVAGGPVPTLDAGTTMPTSGVNAQGFTQGGVTGALPATATPVTVTTTNVPRIFCKVA